VPQLPRPPINTMTDFVVFAFVSLVVGVILVAVVSVSIIEIVNPQTDTSPIVSSLLDIVTTLIGALVGFIAGKGSGRAEVHEQLGELQHDEAVRDAAVREATAQAKVDHETT
jgi:uncharacterized membrane protein YdjX (TVP38/TMEM64 family)